MTIMQNSCYVAFEYISQISLFTLIMLIISYVLEVYIDNSGNITRTLFSGYLSDLY